MLLEIFRPYLLSFIQIFIAIDIIGNIPVFISLTENFSHKQKTRTIKESILYGLALTVFFILFGKYVMYIIGITLVDFKIAGGLLILALSINMLLSKEFKFTLKRRHLVEPTIFPMATPLMAGPALLTMSLIILEKFGIVITLSVLISNMLIIWIVLEKMETIYKLIGEKGLKSLSRIFEILLAAIAVMMIRSGIQDILLK